MPFWPVAVYVVTSNGQAKIALRRFYQPGVGKNFPPETPAKVATPK